MSDLRNYELVLVFDEASDVVAQKNVKDLIVALVEKCSGSVSRFEDWGIRRLAYPIKKKSRAFYYLLNFSLSVALLPELQHILKYETCLIRNLLIQIKNLPVDPSWIMVEKENNPKEYGSGSYYRSSSFNRTAFQAYSRVARPREGGRSEGGFQPREGGRSEGSFQPREGGRSEGGFQPREGNFKQKND